MSILEHDRRQPWLMQAALDLATGLAILIAAGALGSQGFAGLDSRTDAENTKRALMVAGITLGVTTFNEAIRLIRGMLYGIRRILSWIHRSLPRRGSWLRWYHYTFREPPTSPDQARDALARLCGYRIKPGDHRIVSVRPSIRGGRLGVRVTVQRPSQSTRHWTHQDVRWITDPHEWWLLRSAMLDTDTAAPRKTSAEHAEPSAFELHRVSSDELDRLVGSPTPRNQT